MSEINSSEIAEKWNKKYLNDKRFQDAPVRRLVKEYASLLPESGQVLEIAGGMGFTTNYLQNSGLQVFDLDISYHALRKARQRNNAAFHFVADARFMPLKDQQFDVICNFYFLERTVFHSIELLLKPGGILFFETMTLPMQSIRPEIPSDHLLAAGELKSVFPSWKIIHYFEGWTDSDHGHRKAIAQLVAQKPCGYV
jgi:SAM-dependent methyltransferase